MNNDFEDFVHQTSEEYLYEMLVTIFHRIFPGNSILTQILTLAKKHGMPVKNIMPFIQDLGEWCKENQTPSAQELSDAMAFRDLMQRSGFMTIGFTQEGDDPDGNGRDGT